MKRIQPSIAAFALVLVVIGIWGLAQNAFVAIWAPGIRPETLRAPMIVICSLVSIVGGAGLLVPRYSRFAAILLVAFLALWLAWCKGAALVHAPGEFASWESLGETMVILSAAWALLAPGGERKDLRPGRIGGPVPETLYGVALILFGLSHLAYVTPTASLVPAWLPWHVFWVYLTAVTYIAAGAALVTDRFSWPAAALSALQMALFSVLVWLPHVAAGARDPDTLNETILSVALAASGWVIASVIKRRTTRTPAMAPGLVPARIES